MLHSHSIVKAAAVVGACMFGTVAHANLLVNGSFETPVIPAGTFQNFPVGSTAMTGWTVVGIDSALTSGAFVQSGITFDAQDGGQFIDLAGVTSNSKSSGVTQSVATVMGAAYELTFYVGSATDNVFFFPSTIDLSIDGGARTSFTNAAMPTTLQDWKMFTFDFTANGSSTSITLLNGGESNNYLSGLDNVTLLEMAGPVSPVPEPSEVAMMGMGLAMLAAARRWKAKRPRSIQLDALAPIARSCSA